MSAFVKASCAALKAVPSVNASIDDSDPDSPAIVFHDYCDVSVAVATPKVSISFLHDLRDLLLQS
jgi:2-oxoglutarate dehydrogenase E2 component (dihydrolipoamide succinyltransferase)